VEIGMNINDLTIGQIKEKSKPDFIALAESVK
jgi:hypothetical protein